MVKVNQVDKKNFDMILLKIPPCYPAEYKYLPHKDAFYFLNLHPTNSFIMDQEIIGDQNVKEGFVAPTG